MGDRVFKALVVDDASEKYEPNLGAKETRWGSLQPLMDEMQDDDVATVLFAACLEVK